MRYAIYAAIDRDPAKLPWAALDSSLAPLPEVRYVEAQAKGGGIQFRASKLQTLAAIAAAGAARRLRRVPVAPGYRSATAGA